MRIHQTPANRPRHRQQGAALLILLTIVVLASGYALLKRLNNNPEILRASDTAAVLAEAKAALVGYALSSKIPSNQPGRLPCPDYSTDGNLDGLSDACIENGTYVTIGRLPWKTLGLRDLRDASGESLWYAPDINFDGNSQINSETQADLRVVSNNTEQIAAVIIAPGKVTSTQSRPQDLASQTTPGRYLEASNAIADTNISSVAPSPATEFTDQVLVITRDELMQVVERLVLAELRSALNALATLPPPAAHGFEVCDPAPLQQGLLPITADANCPAITLPIWPGWFSDNSTGWQRLIWYAADSGGGITVQDGGTNVTGVQGLLIAVGSEISSFQDRSVSTPPPLNSLLEQTNNDSDLNFEIFPSSPVTNDQLLIVSP